MYSWIINIQIDTTYSSWDLIPNAKRRVYTRLYVRHLENSGFTVQDHNWRTLMITASHANAGAMTLFSMMNTDLRFTVTEHATIPDSI